MLKILSRVKQFIEQNFEGANFDKLVQKALNIYYPIYGKGMSEEKYKELLVKDMKEYHYFMCINLMDEYKSSKDYANALNRKNFLYNTYIQVLHDGSDIPKASDMVLSQKTLSFYDDALRYFKRRQISMGTKSALIDNLN